MPPKITQIAEAALVVTDLERSRRFYMEVLGLREFHYDAIKPNTGVTFHLASISTCRLAGPESRHVLGNVAPFAVSVEHVVSYSQS